MPFCNSCGRKVGILGSLLAYNSQTGLCKQCEAKKAQREAEIAQQAYHNYINNIRAGNLPRVQPSIHLASDELCYLEMPATYQKVNKASIRHIGGRFVVTNKKLYFLSPVGGWTMQWEAVMRVARTANGIYLEMSIQKGNGHYSVPDALVMEAVIDTVAKIAKRQILMAQSDSRHIPQDVKMLSGSATKENVYNAVLTLIWNSTMSFHSVKAVQPQSTTFNCFAANAI